MNISRLLAESHHADIISVTPQTSIRDTARTLVAHKIGAVLVLDEKNTLRGIVSERDLVPVLADFTIGILDQPISTVMTKKVITCTAEDEIAYVLRLMKTNSIRHMPVTHKDVLVGMLSLRALTSAYEMLQIEADTDPLTEVSNRRPFLKTLEDSFAQAQATAAPLSVAMVDLDHFKRVNDTYGHDVGDRVLKAISSMLIAEFRTIDCVGRLGGEEFALVFPGTTLTGAQIACDRLLQNIRKAEIKVGDQIVRVTVSMGLAPMTTAQNSGADLLKRADELLYQAKHTGRDRLVVDQSAP